MKSIFSVLVGLLILIALSIVLWFSYQLTAYVAVGAKRAETK